MDEIQKHIVPSVVYYISIIKASVVLFYSIVRSTYSYDDSSYTEGTLDYAEDSKCLEDVHASHYLWSFRVNNVALSKEIADYLLVIL